LNAEGEKIQAAVRAYNEERLDFTGLITTNDSVENLLTNIIKKEMLLLFKLGNITDIL